MDEANEKARLGPDHGKIEADLLQRRLSRVQPELFPQRHFDYLNGGGGSGLKNFLADLRFDGVIGVVAKRHLKYSRAASKCGDGNRGQHFHFGAGERACHCKQEQQGAVHSLPSNPAASNRHSSPTGA